MAQAHIVSVARVGIVCALLGIAGLFLGCDDSVSKESNPTATPKEAQALSTPESKLIELAPIQNGEITTYLIYEVTSKTAISPTTRQAKAKSPSPYRARLYIKRQDSRILSVAFLANGNRFLCDLHSTLETNELGVANGTLDCQKLFTAVLEQGELTSPKLITQNLASLLPQKDISDIANATTPTTANLRLISSFSTRAYTFIQIDSTNTRGIRLDSICSPDPQIQKIINSSMADYLKLLRIPEPKSCTQANAAFVQITQAMLKQLTREARGIQYYGYGVDFFDERFLQMYKNTYVGLSSATLAHNIKHLLYYQKGKSVALDSELFVKGKTLDKLHQILESKYQQFLRSNPQCQAMPDLIRTYRPDVAMSDDGLSFIYMPSNITTHKCNTITLDFHLYELRDAIPQTSVIYALVARSKAPLPQENTLDTLYLECGKCALMTKHTQKQILALRKALNDEQFYEKTSKKDIDKELLAHYDISLYSSIYNGDYTAIDFNHKYLLDLSALDSTNAYYILYTDGKAPYCMQDTNDNAEIIKYFSISDTIETKGRSVPIDTYLQQNHIDMRANPCTKHAKPI